MDKQHALDAQLDAQKKEMGAFQGDRKRDMESITTRPAELDSSMVSARKNVALLETEAQATLVRFTNEVGRKVDSEVGKAVDVAKGALAQRQSAAEGSKALRSRRNR